MFKSLITTILLAAALPTFATPPSFLDQHSADEPPAIVKTNMTDAGLQVLISQVNACGPPAPHQCIDQLETLIDTHLNDYTDNFKKATAVIEAKRKTLPPVPAYDDLHDKYMTFVRNNNRIYNETVSHQILFAAITNDTTFDNYGEGPTVQIDPALQQVAHTIRAASDDGLTEFYAAMVDHCMKDTKKKEVVGCAVVMNMVDEEHNIRVEAELCAAGDITVSRTCMEATVDEDLNKAHAALVQAENSH